MRAVDRFIARVDALAPESLTDRQLRTRLELLQAELEQLDHDTQHVELECYGEDKFFHLRSIARERSAALEKKTRLAQVLGGRS